MEKIWFFNFKYYAIPRVYRYIMIIGLLAVVMMTIYLIGTNGYGFWFLYVPMLSFQIWQSSRKNALFKIRNDSYQLKLNGKSLTFKSKHITDVYLENHELHLQRINRVDAFKISQCKEEDVRKLIVILKGEHALLDQ